MRPSLVAFIALLPALAGAQTIPTWRVTRDLTIGSDAGPASFNDIRSIGATKKGDIFVLDFKTQEIRMFNAKGEFTKLAARRGHGPGEITNSNGLLVAPDGRIWVNDPGNARFAIFASDGSFDRQLIAPPWGYSYVWNAAVDDKGRLTEYVSVRAPGAQTSVGRYRRFAGGKVDTVGIPSCYPSQAGPPATFTGRRAGGNTFIGVPYSARQVAILDSRGTQWCTPSDEYVVYNSSLDTGDTLAVVRSAAARPPVTQRERDSVIHYVDSLLAPYTEKHADYSMIPRLKPAIAQIFADDRGRLWVQRTPTVPGAGTEYDVWDARGRQVATAKLDVTILSYLRPVVVGDYLYGVVIDADEIQSVIRAKIVH